MCLSRYETNTHFIDESWRSVRLREFTLVIRRWRVNERNLNEKGFRDRADSEHSYIKEPTVYLYRESINMGGFIRQGWKPSRSPFKSLICQLMLIRKIRDGSSRTSVLLELSLIIQRKNPPFIFILFCIDICCTYRGWFKVEFNVIKWTNYKIYCNLINKL